ncbi:DUF4342 domain-containing protein [Oscillatoriales cyanobacterium LEGE 11467]|uniref:DUF4342 domain-containing protein n=1 Tax=Zarconia navalis LEGE 11467 TaxID=1828826 RepID=A0A928Z6X3_9CYAN|nr:DUF4342 domain-containing protein [Zarconia navalis]MBE9040852.1 DUF4342 domain-containing protein [Zarconia navalis LEGE 11467]
MSEPVDFPQEPIATPNPPPLDPEVQQIPHKVRVEEFQVSGDTLVSKVKELIHQGNIRRIIIKDESRKTLLEIPLTVGLVGGALAVTIAPILAAIGAIGALVARLTIVIEKVE